MSFSIDFPPMTDEEIEKLSIIHLMEKGEYNFQVMKAIKRIHPTSGNTVVDLTFKSWDKNGVEKTIFDTLVFTPKMMWKIKHFCEATNQLEVHEKGKYDENTFLNRSGKFFIDIEKEKPNPNGGMYKAKNKVLDYLPSDPNNKAKQPANSSNDFHDDDLPF